ncbi:phage tail assembly protein [Shigella sonnei]
MTMIKPYTQIHKLRWPVAGMDSVTVSTVPLGTMRKLRAEFGMDADESEQDRHGFLAGVFKAHTGLSDEQRGSLMQPDLNSITNIIQNFVIKPSYELVADPKKKDKKPANPDTFPLLVPVIDPMRGQEPITELTMVPPTVRLTDSVSHLNGFARERELVATCTDLMPEVVDTLHMPDWVATQNRINDFLYETADYFPQLTSKD